jgi:lipoate-protein ligase A
MGLKIVTTVDHADKIMQKDADLLERLAEINQPILHLYRFKEPSITYGHFIQIEKMLKKDELELNQIETAKRPTGGGIIFHLYDLAFSFLLPSSHLSYSKIPLENYAFVNTIVKEAILPLMNNTQLKFLPIDPKDPSDATHFCMAKPTIYDVMIDDKKIVGAAQRNKNQGFLHQGSIAIQKPSSQLLRKILVNPDDIIPKMKAYSHYFLDTHAHESEKEELIGQIQKALTEQFLHSL